jgi:hypothetical protein
MSYFRKQRALSGVSTEIPSRAPVRFVRTSLGSLGDDPPTGTTLSQPTLLDPATAQFQQLVTQQLTQGVELMRTANLTKWLQIAATLTIPLAAVAWKRLAPHLFKKATVPSVTG